MRKNFPVDEEVHKSLVAHLSHIESNGGGLPSITSWIKAAVLEKIARDRETNRKERYGTMDAPSN
jgi:hypothetical protein